MSSLLLRFLCIAAVLPSVLLFSQALPAEVKTEIPPDVQVNEPAAVTHGPWLTHPDVGAVTIGFTTTTNCGGGLEYREVDTEPWLQAWDALAGQINKLRIQHPIRLTGLKQDTEYEYRLLIFQPWVKYPSKSAEYSKVKRVTTVENPSWRFRTFTDRPQDYHIALTSDLQFSAKQKDIYLTMGHENCDMGAAKFFATLGDYDDNYDNFEISFMNSILDPIVRLGGSSRPTLFVRGNHEWRGQQSIRWCEYFPAPQTGLPYTSFRCGEAFYLMLDSGEDKQSTKLSFHYTGGNIDNDAYNDEQARWLNTVVASEPFRTAKYRIILSHAAIHSHTEKYMHDALSRILGGHFRKDAPEERIHLWLSGHTHNYERTVPGTDTIYWLEQGKRPVYPPGDYPFPVVTNDGPGFSGQHNTVLVVHVSSERLTVEAKDPQGALLDTFEILPDGSCIDKNDGTLPAKPFPAVYRQ